MSEHATALRRLAGPAAAGLAALLLAPAAGAAATGAVAGTVSGAGGAGLAGALVTVVEAPCAAGGCADGWRATAGDDGAYRVDGLPPGEYLVHAADPSGERGDGWWGGGAEPGATVMVADGETVTGVDFALPPAARVRGRVRDADGRALAGATVTARRTAFSAVEDVSGAEGGFELDGLAARTYELRVAAPAAGLGDGSATVAVGAGEVVEVEAVLALVPVELVRLAGDTRITTAVAASGAAFAAAEEVVVAAAGSFPDALAAAPLAAALDAPLLLVGARLDEAVADEVRRLGAVRAVVVGAVGAVPLAVQEDLRALGVEVRRVPGETRFDTAALIARELGAPGGEAVVASGMRFPDALSVAPLAAAHGLPILLTASESLVRDTAEALAAIEVARTLVVGGRQAVSDGVVARLPSPTRLSGAERYATSVAVAREVVRRGGSLATVSAATGRAYPDALAAGPVAARAGGPVLLVDGTRADGSPTSYEFLAARRAEVAALQVFGGTAAVARDVARRLVEAAGP